MFGKTPKSIMLARRERRQTALLLDRFRELVANFRQIIAIHRNVAFFTTGYNWLIQIIPVLVVAPAFMRGDIDFGAITQSAMAFTTLVAAFSLVVTQFQSLSTFAAVVARLSSLTDAVEQSQAPTGPTIEIVETDWRLAYERLTLLSSTGAGPLLNELSVSIPVGTRVLVTGSNQAAGVALCKATAGVWTAGSGRIIRPGADGVLFLAQRPYLPPGTLRQILEVVTHQDEISDDRIFTLLRELNLEQVVTQAGGLNSEQNWRTLLSLREQQLLALVHIVLAAPPFVFLDRVGAVLSSDEVQKIFQLLNNSSTTSINIGAADEPRNSTTRSWSAGRMVAGRGRQTS